MLSAVLLKFSNSLLGFFNCEVLFVKQVLYQEDRFNVRLAVSAIARSVLRGAKLSELIFPIPQNVFFYAG